jgi:regulatory protein
MIDPKEFLRQHPVVIAESSDEQSSELPDRTSHAHQQSSLRVSRLSHRHPGTWEKEDDGSEEPDSEFARCQEAALRSLDAAGASEEGLRQRLSRKSFSPDVIDRVVKELERQGVLNDTDYAQSIYERGLRKGLGAFGMRREMRLKGIPDEIIKRFVDQGEEEGSFDQAAHDLAESILRRSENVDGQKLVSRLVSGARRKGQSVSLVMKYARELSANEI